MAAPRWRLINAHYINVIVDGERSAWEYAEQSRQTGRMIRKKHQVPLLLDPKDPADHNYPELGLIIICRGEPDRGYDRDFQFFGEPTPDMEPMNDEAQAITDSFRETWKHPIETLSGNYGDEVQRTFEEQLKLVMANAMKAPPQATAVGTDVAAQLKAMQDQINNLMAQNAELQVKQAVELTDEKIVGFDKEEPLEDLPVDPPVAPPPNLRRQPPVNRPPQVASRR